MRIKEIIRTIMNSDYDGSGASCEFFEYGNIGIKTYSSEKIRDICFERQSAAADHMLAPKAFFKFTFKTKERVWYCYATELATVLTDEDDIFHVFDIEDYMATGNDTYIENALMTFKLDELIEIKEQIEFLVDKLAEETGLDYCDCHTGNFGRLSCGTLVIIDFDTLSCNG